MAVLVDQAIWDWRGARWAHLVSDESYDELHEFARRLGKRRLGFQGDHYDVDSVDRERALALGAQPLDARELVRRLRAGGLRRRDAKPTWRRLSSAEVGETLAVPPGQAVPRSLSSAIGLLGSLDRFARSALFIDDQRAAALFDWFGDVPALPEIAVDRVWSGEPRADGERSLELFAERSTW